MTESVVLRLVTKIYEAATEPAAWPGFLEAYTDAVSADITVLQVHEPACRRSTILSGFGLSSPLRDSYNVHYSRLNIWRERGRRFYTRNGVTLSRELCPIEDLRRSEFYNDYLLRINAAHCMGIVFAVGGGLAPCVTALRGPSRDEFDQSHRHFASQLIPHLVRMWEVQKQMGLLRAATSALDQSPTGVVFLDTHCRVLYCNRRADELLRSRDGILMEGRALKAVDRAADTALQQILKSAVSRTESEQAGLLIPRRSSAHFYQLVAGPVLNSLPACAGLPSPSAVVFIIDAERHEPVCADLLTQLYGLTCREAALVARLSAGSTVEEAAERLGITYETARTHLRRVLDKTGTKRQAELALLVAQLPREKRA